MRPSESWVLATSNPGKIREFRHRLDNAGVDLRSLEEFGPTQADETGTTFVENAIIKARAAAGASGMSALADDSGLCVDALGGAPGVLSARYAGPGCSDEDNNRRLLEQLEGVKDRSARFCCVLAWMRSADDPLPKIFTALWEGKIVHQPRGRQGFGYDPLFYLDSHSCTSAQLDPETKNRFSHRGQAIDQLVDWLSRR